MPLPTFRSLAARRNKEPQKQEEAGTSGEPNGVVGQRSSSERTLTETYQPGVDVKLATRTRRNWIIVSSLFFLISVIFLILVFLSMPFCHCLANDASTFKTIIGNISKDVVIRSTYFYKLNLSNIIPTDPGSDTMLVNSLARSLGLHDFYQVGLWNFCEGYNDEGITYCSPTQTLYWFNPVEVLLNELLAGATITLPAEVNNILMLIRIASHIMFGFFLTGVCMNFVSIFLVAVVLYSRWWSLPIAIWTFIAALLTTAAAIIGTVMSVIFKNVLTSQPGLDIDASIGTDMFAFMWVGAGFSILGFAIHLGMSCCCASRRDVISGRRKGRLSAYGDVTSDEKKRPIGGGCWAKMPKFGRTKTAGEVA
jgi:hypothetical protein